MPIKDIPKSLIDSVVDVVTKSVETHEQLLQKVVTEGLARFGVKSIADLSEGDLKAFHAWTQIRLNEASCSCGGEVDEDDMPGDSVYHKDGEESGEKKKELDEEDEDSESVVAEDSRSDSLKVVRSALASSETKSKIAAHLSKITSAPSGKDRATIANKILNLLGKDPSFARNNDKFNKALGKVVHLATDSKATPSDLVTPVKKALEALNESVAEFSDEIATNGAVAVGDASVAEPKHADVIHDTDPYTGITQYRLLLQYATNEGTRIYPPVSLPGANSVADLRTLVEGLPDFNDAVDAALVHASSSSLSESVIKELSEDVALTDESKVIPLIKSELKVSHVAVDEYTSSGRPVVEFTAEFKTKDKDYNTLFVVCHEEPSKKTSGKNLWIIRLDNGDDSVNVNSDVFAPGDTSKSLSVLKDALRKAVPTIKSWIS